MAAQNEHGQTEIKASSEQSRSRLDLNEIASIIIENIPPNHMICDSRERVIHAGANVPRGRGRADPEGGVSAFLPDEMSGPVYRLLERVRETGAPESCDIAGPAGAGPEPDRWTVIAAPLLKDKACAGFSLAFQDRNACDQSEHLHLLKEHIAIRTGYLEQTVARLQQEMDRRENAEIELRRSEEKYRAIFEKNQAMIAVLDPETGAIVDANPAASEFYGYPRSMAPRLFNWDISATPKERLLELLSLAASGKLNKWKAAHRTASGELRWVEMFMSPFQSQGRTLLHVIVLDITEKKRAQETLRRNEEFLQAVLDNTSILVFVKCAEGKYLYVNKAFERAFEVPLSAILAARDHSLFPEQTAGILRQHDALVMDSGIPMEFEETLPSKGRPRTYLTVKVPLCGMDGKPYAVCGVANDITELKRTEEQLRDERANLERRVQERTRELEDAKRALEQDVARRRVVEQALRRSEHALHTLSQSLICAQEHERRNLAREVHDIMGEYLTLSNIEFECLKRQYPETGEFVAEFMRRGKEFSDTMRKICYGLHPVLLDRFGLSASLEDYTREFEARAGIPVLSSISQVDRGAISPETALCVFRVLQESLTNVSRHAGASRVWVRLETIKGRLVLNVRDDGQGFDPGLSGPGLGLFGMKERAQACGGALAIRSSPGQGVEISLRVPL